MKSQTPDTTIKKSQFTPGEWIVEPVFIAQQSGGACHFGEYRFPFQVEDGHSKTYPREEAEANARLIAAAPALYEALKATSCRYSRQRECARNIVDMCDRCAALALVDTTTNGVK